MPDIVDDIQDITRAMLKKHQPLALEQTADYELECLERHYRAADH